ncbi:MAG: glycosyltransferase family 4 protein, partial [Anaerolineales bacterium]
MRIGLDITAAVSQGAGIGRYTRELLRALSAADTHHQYQLFFASQTRPHALPPLAPNFHITALPFHDIWLARVWHRARLPIPVQLITGPLDLFHSPDFTLPPVFGGTRTLLTVHDLSFVRDPASAAPTLRRYLNTVVPRSVARADHILADSQATKDDLIDLYQTPAEKVTVLYSGVEAAFRPVTDPARLAIVRAKYKLGAEPFIFAISTLQPRKNFVRLIQAFA